MMPSKNEENFSRSLTGGLRIFFGGTFDPPHLGHDFILRSLCEDTLTESVHLVPTRVNPLKSTQPQGNPEVRLRWVKLWLANIKTQISESHDRKIHLETFEIESPLNSASFSYDSLTLLKKKWGGQWALSGGADLLADLEKWHRVDELLGNLHSLWIFNRSGMGDDPLTAFSSCELSKFCSLRVMSRNAPLMSSTEIRNLLKGNNASREKLKQALIPSVYEDLVQGVGAL